MIGVFCLRFPDHAAEFGFNRRGAPGQKSRPGACHAIRPPQQI